MRIKFRLFLFLLLIVPLSLVAQDITLTVKSKKQVRVGEQFQLIFELNAEGNNFQVPTIENAQIISGPMSSTSSNVQIVNGAVTRSFTQSYTYYLQASKEGEIKIGEAFATVQGKKIKSEPATIKVVAGNTQTQNNSNASGNASTTGINNDDLFFRAVVNKKNAFVGEQLTITYKLYTKVQVSSINVSKSSNFGGFWTKNLTDNSSNFVQTTEIINGEEYVVAEIQQYALFPQRSGKLTIDPMEIECTAVVRSQSSNNRRSYDPFESFFNDPFFNRNYTNVQKKLTANTIDIDVQQLPLANKPISFNGAVGQFDFRASIDQDNLKTNEAFTLVMTISGKGNIELVDFPSPNFPPDFEVYDPKITSNVKPSASGISGTKKAEYLVIPRVHGDFTIDSLVFSYFDPVDKKYKSTASNVFQIHVTKGTQSSDSDISYNANQEGIKYLGSDIHHIKTEKLALRKKQTVFFLSTPYFVTITVIVIIFFVVLFYYAKKMKLNKNQMLMHNKKATKIARKRLKNARQYLKQRQQNEFYIEMSQALWGYIVDKFSIARSDLSMDTVRKILFEKNMPEELINKFIATLENCEFARFAPGDTNKKMDDLYTQGIDVITKVEKRIK
ncbi:MAG: BatD family protein [Lentimicrobiaceae bacterium]|jgi:hypothetical protein|nr:BatD family protein [Lentimicrobiaceae bacterium]